MPTKPRYRKTIGLLVEFPVNYDRERIDMIREEAAEKLADALRLEILKEMGPNWFFCHDGMIHQPGQYRIKVDFAIENRLENDLGITIRGAEPCQR